MNFEISVIPEWSTFIAQILSTLVLFIVVKYFLFKPVSVMVNERKEKIQNDVFEANKRMKDVEELKGQYVLKIENAKDEARHIINAAKHREDEFKAETLKEVKNQVEIMFVKAKHDIQVQKDKAMNEVKYEAIETAAIMASKIVNESLSEDTHKEVIRKFIDEVEELEWQS
jgi:F-type H+-transporting ATPase subunit b